MNRTSFCLTAAAVFCLSANLFAADKWKSAQVLPKDPAQLILRGNATRPGNEYAANAFQISWPSRVEKINGQWILIGDKGGYSVPPVKGWVRKEEMLSIEEDDTKAGEDDPSQFLSTKILETTDPTALASLYWLRGIYWEGQQESQVALRNYSATIHCAFGQKVDPSLSDESVTDLFDPNQGSAAAQEAMGRFPGLADAYLRLARLSAKSASRGMTMTGLPATATSQAEATKTWENYFSCADYLFRLRSPSGGPYSKVPSAETAWANALASQYKRLAKKPDAKKGKVMKTSYSGAGSKTPVATADQQAKEAQQLADRANALYQSALSVNPSWGDAFLGRGQLLMDQAGALADAQGTTRSQQCQTLYNQAIQQFTLAVQLNPKSKEAFRNRAEAYQSLALHYANNDLLKDKYEDRTRFLSQAAQSADAASQLGRDRDPECLELLASVIANQGEVCSQKKRPSDAANYFKQASYVLQEAATFPNANRAELLNTLAKFRQNEKAQEKLKDDGVRGDDEPEKQLPFYIPGSNLFGDRDRD